MKKLDLRNDPLPDDHWLTRGVYDFPQYKGVYYAYDKYDDTWNLYDNFFYGSFRIYDASKFRLDQCFDFWFKIKNLFKK